MTKIRYPDPERLRMYFINQRAGLTDSMLLIRFKQIRYQCKWQGRAIDTLLEYINELEYRGLKYRL